MPYGIIYKVTNTQNKKIYIGQTTKKMKERIRKHYSNSKSKRYKNNMFYEDIKIYDEKIFVWEIIDYCCNDIEMDEKEKHWIEYYQSNKIGYNCTTGGKTDFTFNDMAKIKFSKAWHDNPINKIHLNEIGKKAINKQTKEDRKQSQINRLKTNKKGVLINENIASLIKHDIEKGMMAKEVIEKYKITKCIYAGIKYYGKWAWVQPAC